MFILDRVLVHFAVQLRDTVYQLLWLLLYFSSSGSASTP